LPLPHPGLGDTHSQTDTPGDTPARCPALGETRTQSETPVRAQRTYDPPVRFDETRALAVTVDQGAPWRLLPPALARQSMRVSDTLAAEEAECGWLHSGRTLRGTLAVALAMG
jgi:hypothetical protein